MKKLLLLALLLPNFAFGAVTLNAVMAAGNNGDTHALDNQATTITTTGITVAAGTDTLLVVAVNWQANESVSAPGTRVCTWNTTETLTEQVFVTNATSRISIGIYTRVNPTDGAQSLSCTFVHTGGCGCSDIYLGAIAFDGVDQTTPVVVAHSTSNTGSASLGITGGSGDGTIASYLIAGGEATTSQTIFWGYDALSPGGSGSYELGGTGTVTHTFTGSGTISNAAIAGIHIQDAGGAASGLLLRRRRN